MKKRAFITGVMGMDGSHLADFLLNKGYNVFGLYRRSTVIQRPNIQHLLGQDDFTLIPGDLTDEGSLLRALQIANPDQVYNLAAQSFVQVSFKQPVHTSDVTGLGVLRMLEAIRQFGKKDIKFYQAGSSEMFGKMIQNPANQYTPFHPRSPYGCAKAFGYYITQNYRQAYDMFCCNGILFNHESERRGKEFVTRKITSGIKQILDGKIDHIELGNIQAKRDWGYSPLFVKAMWLMLQQDIPDDYVVSSGENHSIKEFLQIAFEYAGLGDYNKYIVINPEFYRPSEVDVLLGDCSKIKRIGWQYTMSFQDLVKIMVDKQLGRKISSSEI